MQRYTTMLLVAVVAFLVALSGASLGMALIAGLTAGCFCTLNDISYILRKSG